MSTPPQRNPVPEPVPQLDLSAQYAAIGGEIRTAIERVMASQHFVLGREGAALEEEIARLCGVAHGVGLASGTDALILALRACGVHAGDEVLLPPFTFVATGSAVSTLGATPVFVDIRPDTYNLDPSEFERRVTPRPRSGHGPYFGVCEVAQTSGNRGQCSGHRRILQRPADRLVRRRWVPQLLPPEKTGGVRGAGAW